LAGRKETGADYGKHRLRRNPLCFDAWADSIWGADALIDRTSGGFHDQRWFAVPMGWGTAPLLEAMRINYEVVTRAGDIRTAIMGAVKSMNSIQAPVAVLFAGELLF